MYFFNFYFSSDTKNKFFYFRCIDLDENRKYVIASWKHKWKGQFSKEKYSNKRSVKEGGWKEHLIWIKMRVASRRYVPFNRGGNAFLLHFMWKLKYIFLFQMHWFKRNTEISHCIFEIQVEKTVLHGKEVKRVF